MSEGSRIRILHIFGRLVRGGAEMRTLDLMRHIDRRKFQFHFCVLEGLPGELDREVESLGGKVHYCRLDAGFNRRFRALLRRERFDAVHSHVHFFSGWILKLAARENVPKRICHFRITEDGKKPTVRRKLQNRLMKRWIDRHATNILSVCEGAMEVPWGKGWRKDPRCEVIYNGLDTSPLVGLSHAEDIRSSLGVPTGGKLILHIGRMVPVKNQMRAIRIFHRLVQEEPDARLFLIGGGSNLSYAEDVEQLVAVLGLSGKVRLLGVRGDVPALLQAADMLLFPSRLEGLPGVVLEACACGTPVLGSDLPGIREIAERLPGVRVCPLEEPDEEWVRMTKTTLSDKPSAGQRAAAKAAFGESEFSIAICADKLSAVWSAP